MSNSNKKKNKGIAGFLLLFGWLLFALFAIVFYFYFWDSFPFNPKSSETNTSADSGENVAAYDTIYTYKTNDNLDINVLITDYFDAYTSCNTDKLKELVVEPSQFDDASSLEKQAKYITGHYNINCYTVPGYTEDATLVYVTSNLNINDVAVTPLDIQRFYIRNIDGTYKIDNSMLSAEETEYINSMQSNADIQGLYNAVNTNINQYLENDPAFANFYNEVIKAN